jgi:hypothetical protein
MAAPAAELHVLRLRRRLALARGDPGPPVTNSLPTLTSPPYGGLVRSQNVSPWCRMAKAWRWIPKRGAGYRSLALDTEAWHAARRSRSLQVLVTKSAIEASSGGTEVALRLVHVPPSRARRSAGSTGSQNAEKAHPRDWLRHSSSLRAAAADLLGLRGHPLGAERERTEAA